MNFKDTPLVIKSREYAFSTHKLVNQKYGDACYTLHLQTVYETGLQYLFLIPEADREDVLAACYLHDIIEDARETYNEVRKRTNKRVAELVFALTNEKGRDRATRANEKYYKGIRNLKYATYIKLCDRISNVEYSKINSKSMFAKYRDENASFCAKIYTSKYDMMFMYLIDLFAEITK